jgi:hypothetical protein
MARHMARRAGPRGGHPAMRESGQKRNFVAILENVLYIQDMTRPNLVRLAVVSTLLTLAFPLASYANAPGPVKPRTVSAPQAEPVRPAPPSDTLTKLEKAKSARPAPAPKKKLKARQAVPAPTRAEFVPDQPWETDFYVENDISGRRAMQIALASYTPRR